MITFNEVVENFQDAPIQCEDPLRELAVLRGLIEAEGQEGLCARIRFLAVAYKYQLVDNLRRDQLLDTENNLGKESYYLCYDQGDRFDVITGIYTLALVDSQLMESLIASESRLLKHWTGEIKSSLVVTGSQLKGFQYIGPFPTPEFASEWAEIHMAGKTFWITELEAPPTYAVRAAHETKLKEIQEREEKQKSKENIAAISES